ncbi:MAG: hypothetical protein PVI59_11230 [Anaerolineae bacterium]
MRRLKRLINVPTILVAVLILLLTLAALAVVLAPGGGLPGAVSHFPTPTREIGPLPDATRQRPTAEAISTPAQATEVPSTTSTTLPPSAEPSSTSEPPMPSPMSTGLVRPVAECVTANGDGTYTAYFGYRNDGDETVTVPVGPRNHIVPAPEDRGQPTTFSPGGTSPWPNAPFSAIFSSSSLGWTVEGQTATVSTDSPRCAYRVHIDVKWYGTDGRLLAGPPDSLPPGFAITAQSQLGSATCTYPSGSSSLACQYESQSGAGDALLVPPDTSYAIDESELPADWQPFSGTGVFPGNGSSEFVSHVVVNRAAGAPPASPTSTPTPSEASRPTPTGTPPEPVEATESPTVAGPSPTHEPPSGTGTAAPAAVGQITPSPLAGGTPAPLLPATGSETWHPCLTVRSLILGLVLTLLGGWTIWRRRAD